MRVATTKDYQRVYHRLAVASRRLHDSSPRPPRRHMPPKHEPTLEEIEEACAAIQSQWTEEEERDRRTGGQDIPELTLTPVRLVNRRGRVPVDDASSLEWSIRVMEDAIGAADPYWPTPSGPRRIDV